MWMLVVITHVYYGSVVTPVHTYQTQDECKLAGAAIVELSKDVGGYSVAKMICLETHS